MSRILLVDDEPLVTGTLQTLILESMPDLEVCSVHSGSEAMELLSKNAYDVVVTDVSMPRISGLDLLDHIKKQGNICYVIVLTAYNSFNYAYKVSQYEDVRFILKIEPPDVILDAIRTGLERVHQYYSATEGNEQIRQYMQETLPLFRQTLLERLLAFGEELPDRTVCESCGIQSISGQETWLAVTGSFESREKQQEICYLVLSMLRSRNIRADAWYADTSLVFLMQEDGNSMAVPAAIQGQLDRIIEGAGTAVGLSFVLSSRPVLWDRIGESTSALLRYAHNVLENSRIMLWDPPEEGKRHIGSGDVFRWRRNIEQRNLQALTDDLTDSIRREGYPQGRQKCAVLLQMQLQEIFGDTCLEGLKANGYTAEAILLHRHFSSQEEWLAQVRALLETLFSGSCAGQASETDETLDRINRYIQEQFSSQISLTGIAEHFNYNSSYLSRIYKQNMHEGINEHMTRIRIEAACRLLRDSDLSVGRIAEQCGFQTTKYFITAFKRVKGVTPKNWRDNPDFV